MGLIAQISRQAVAEELNRVLSFHRYDASTGGLLSMSIIGTIIVGLVVGIIAKLFVHGPGEPSGFILTAIVGIVGSFLASWFGQAIGWYQPGQAAGWIMSVLGAVVVMVIWGAVVRRSA
jgi:uncharacterized membrane protein YeaQ/YmgE (transglycosylase-associated protein family)